MKKTIITSALLAIAAVVGACSSLPNSTSLLDQTRGDYRVAQNNPNVVTYAPLEIQQAGDALAQANAAAAANENDEKIDQLAYLAKQKIALAVEVAKRKEAEARVLNAASERDQILLSKRSIEVVEANKNAENARLAAQDAQARNAQLEAQLAELRAVKTERGMLITLGDVLFGTDLARLNSEGIRTTQKLAAFLAQNPQRTVLIEGFADSTGSAAHNQELSERRARAVRNALVEMGVDSGRITARGYGEAYPVAANDTAQNRELNRRVEIFVSDDTGKIPQR